MNTLVKSFASIVISSALLTMTPQVSASATKLEQAIAGEHRSAKNKARDQYRNPKETLEFFGFKSDMTVVEITPGGGWYTEILAPALKGTGKLYGAHYPDTGDTSYYSKSRRNLEKKLASSEIFNEVILTDFDPKKGSQLAPAESADLVLTFRNLHNWGETGMQQVFKDAYQALKKGGVLGVVEHRMPASQDWEKNKSSGYVPQALAVKYAEAAGFTLADTSEVNANAKDTANHPKGVWTLPPRLALEEKDKEKYLAIGESDRMTLKFVK
ncbi:class I SAM-dependent methyltransferase [Thalassotalea ganghwensis]